jgi:hypothetical protein
MEAEREVVKNQTWIRENWIEVLALSSFPNSHKTLDKFWTCLGLSLLICDVELRWATVTIKEVVHVK